MEVYVVIQRFIFEDIVTEKVMGLFFSEESACRELELKRDMCKKMESEKGGDSLSQRFVEEYETTIVEYEITKTEVQ